MLLEKEKITFTDKVLQLLEPMGKIVISEATENKYISKNRITFAKICDNQVYLRDPAGYGYSPVDEDTLKNNDLFLKQATNAYWLAKEEKEKFKESP